MAAKSLVLQRAIEGIAVPGILVDHRVIASGDEFALLPEEYAAFATSVVKVRRASGAARIVARELFHRMGWPQSAITKSTSGAPIWPNGVVGSLAHDAEIAVAAVTGRRDLGSLGVDVEPAEPLDPELFGLIATTSECERYQGDPRRSRLLFSVKEAVYKAVYPIDGVFLDHHDVEVSLETGLARVRNGRTVPFRYCIAAHIVVLAFTPVLPID